MNIHIVGAGSLGLLYGAKLAETGHDVTLWCRSEEQAERIRGEGIVVDHPDGRRLHVQSKALKVKTLARFAGEGGAVDADFLFLMLKQQGIEAAAKDTLAPFGESPRRLVCFQNGIGHMERLHEWLPAWQLYAAVTTEGAKRTGPASVLHAGRGTTAIGKLLQFQSPGTELTENYIEMELAKQLSGAGLESFLSKEMEEMMYRKLLMNAVINPLTALWRIRNGELLSSPRRIAVMKELYEEGIAVYEAGNLPWGSGLWDQIEQVCRSTSGNTSSMLKDVLEGRTTEAPWINGSLVRLGKRYGVDTPKHELVLQLIEGLTI